MYAYAFPPEKIETGANAAGWLEAYCNTRQIRLVTNKLPYSIQ